MKSYTDLEQSKKLAEILPSESADMCWCNNSIKGVNYTDEFSAYPRTLKEMKDTFDSAFSEWDKYWKLIPCWSLSALLRVMPKGEGKDLSLVFGSYDGGYHPLWFCTYEETPTILEICPADNPIDACVEMIYKLKEKELT